MSRRPLFQMLTDRGSYVWAADDEEDARRRFAESSLFPDTNLLTVYPVGERNETIRARRAAGSTLREIATSFDLSVERIRQICLG